MSDQDRSALFAFLGAQKVPGDYAAAARAFFAPDARVNIVHPFNDMIGPEAYVESFLNTLLESFEGLFRRDYIATQGVFEGQSWATATGYYVGHHAKPWLGIPASNALTYLRVGEFHRMENGRAVESYIFLDIPELMIARGVWPVTSSPGVDRGYTAHLPGPASSDGLRLTSSAQEHSARSVQLVTDMLRGLATEDEAWRPYWHENMMWYGPAAFGAFVGIENFAGFQVPFEQTFAHWSGGASNNGVTRHATRAADGDYVWTCGWPSLLAKGMRKPFLDVEPKGQDLQMRVCDWWRLENEIIMENWVFVDIPDALRQLGVDVFEGLEP